MCANGLVYDLFCLRTNCMDQICLGKLRKFVLTYFSVSPCFKVNQNFQAKGVAT
jgi:hypothetical protein